MIGNNAFNRHLGFGVIISFVFLKAAALCKQVISVSFSNELREELSGKKFSILIDETTDTSTSKLLAVIVRHWDSRSKRVLDDLLGLLEVDSTTGEALFSAVERQMRKFNLDMKNCVSFASDGARKSKHSF